MMPSYRRAAAIMCVAGSLIAGGILAASAGPLQTAFDPKDLPSNLHAVLVQNVPIVYTDQGKGDPLIVLPSYPFGTKFWADVSGRLSGSVRVIVVEPPGFRDPSSMRGDYTSQHLLYLYRDFAKALGFNTVHVMGEGEGGGLAVALCPHFPEITGAVVSINGFESVNWSEGFGGTLNLFQQAAFGGLGTLLSLGSEKYRDHAPPREEMGQWLVPLQEEDQKKAVRDRFKSFASDVQQSYILAMLPNFNRHLLLLGVENDQLLPDEEKFVNRTRGQIRRVSVEYQVVPKAGHFAILDQPDKVAELVGTFLSKYPISSSAPRTH
jgi:pimeloyl-ACP methyl ester carboxylesterase